MDLGTFYGSDYFLSRVGGPTLRLEDLPKRLGDAFFDTRLIRDAVVQATGQRWLDAGVTDDRLQYKALIDNAAAVSGTLRLAVGVALTGARAQAGGAVEALAGRDLTVASVVDSLRAEGWTRKSSSSTDSTEERSTHQAAEIRAGGSVLLGSLGGDLTLRRADVSAGGDLTLLAPTGTVSLLGGTDSSFEQHKRSGGSLLWQSSRDRGEVRETFTATRLETGGALTITAGQGVIAELPVRGDLKASLAEAAAQPGMAWVAQLATRPDVNWRLVQEHYDSWDHKSQGLTGPAAALIAIAVSIATYGAGAGLGVGLGAAEGGALAAGIDAAASAAVSTLASQATVSLINNRGNIGAVLKEMGSSATVRSLLIAMGTAGLTAGISQTTGFKDLLPSGDALQDRIMRQAISQGLKVGVDVTLQSTIGGQDVGSALRTGLLNAASTIVGQEMFRSIGAIAHDANISDGDLRKAVAHAVAGGIAAKLTGGDFALAAAGAAVNELLSDAVYSLSPGKAIGEAGFSEADQQALQRRIQLAGLIGASVAALAGGDAQDISRVAAIVSTAQAYNRELHPAETALIKQHAKGFAQLQACKADPACDATDPTAVSGYGVTESQIAEAQEDLRNQALTQVNLNARQLPNDFYASDSESARAYLKNLGMGQAILNTDGTSTGQTLFVATGSQFTNPLLNLRYVAEDPDFYRSLGDRLSDPTRLDALIRADTAATTSVWGREETIFRVIANDYGGDRAAYIADVGSLVEGLAQDGVTALKDLHRLSEAGLTQNMLANTDAYRRLADAKRGLMYSAGLVNVGPGQETGYGEVITLYLALTAAPLSSSAAGAAAKASIKVVEDGLAAAKMRTAQIAGGTAGNSGGKKEAGTGSAAGEGTKGAETPASSQIAREKLRDDLFAAQKKDPRIGTILPGAKAPVVVTAESTIGGRTLVDTNQTARPLIMADPNKPTLISDLILPGEPNSTMQNAHAEIGLIQQAFDAGLTQGQSMTIIVRGQAVCSFCMRNLNSAADRSGLNRLQVVDTVDREVHEWIRGSGWK